MNNDGENFSSVPRLKFNESDLPKTQQIPKKTDAIPWDLKGILSAHITQFVMVTIWRRNVEFLKNSTFRQLYPREGALNEPADQHQIKYWRKRA